VPERARVRRRRRDAPHERLALAESQGMAVEDLLTLLLTDEIARA